MRGLVLALVLAQQAASPAPQSAPPDPPRANAAAVRQIISDGGAEVAVAFRTLDGRDELLIDADKPFHAASTMKVPVMIELFRQVRDRRLSLDDTLTIRNEFRSIVDGSSYRLSEGDDSDREVYAAAGRTLTLGRLCELMIAVSSNFATNLLIEKLGVANVRETVDRLGAGGMHVLRGVEDGKAFEKGLNNTTTARGLLVLLEKLARGEAVDAVSDAAMVDILKRQKFKDGIPAGLPAGIQVAHKTGNITRIHHDAGIVFARRPYVLVVLVRGVEDQKKSAALIARLSRALYEP
jgi:beta-lactamase class A